MLSPNVGIYVYFAATQNIAVTDNIPKLTCENYKIWIERVLLHLGYMDIDYAIQKDEPPQATDTSTSAAIALYERWERSNRLSLMFIKIKINASDRGPIEHHDKVHELLKAIDDQFKSSYNALASTLVTRFSTARLNAVKGVRAHINYIRDIVAQLKTLEVEMFESFLVYYILNTIPLAYAPFKISYNIHKDKWSINELMAICVQEEGRLLAEQGEITQSAHLAVQENNKT